jgi:hypothetical protein
MALPKWLAILQTVGLAALQASPLAPIAVPVAAAIAEAEAIKGATGAQKLDHSLAIAVKAAETAKDLGVHIEPSDVQTLGASAISTAVQATNLVHKAHG